MARWTGDEHIGAVLSAADGWRNRCFLTDGSILSDLPLWTAENLSDLKQRYVKNPILGSDLNFYEKLRQQLEGASENVIKLAAEVVWFYLLFPHRSVFGPETKIGQVQQVWSWSGASPVVSPFLEENALMGVGHPGTAYLTRRHDQFEFMLTVFCAWKEMPSERRSALWNDDQPWGFVKWLDTFPNVERRPMRNAMLYFLFPDTLERNLSNDHRRQIVGALATKIPENAKPKSKSPTLLECDRAIAGIRSTLETELGTRELDFYRPPIYEQWWGGVRDKIRNTIANEIKNVLNNYGLELNQCGTKKARFSDYYEPNEATGYWLEPNKAVSKPPRWLIHFWIHNGVVTAGLPGHHGDKRISYFNTAQGKTSVTFTRILPVIKVGNDRFIFLEAWEWILVHCFFPPLPRGSAAQVVEEFDPATGKLRYMEEERPYINAALITLNESDDVFSSAGLSRPIEYREVTEALARLIHVESD